MKFLTDAMLGKLTRFLRMFGYDTIYADELESYFKEKPVKDDNLILYAKNHNRIIITKDLPLYKKFEESTVYLKGKGVYSYLSQLKDKIGLEIVLNMNNARCSVCNSKLKKVNNRNAIKDKLEEDTFNNYSEFFQCTNPDCGKIFWRGSHIDDILRRLDSNKVV